VVHRFGDHQQPRFLAHLSQDLQAGFAHALVAVRGSAGFVGPAPEDLRALGLDQVGYGQGLGLAFNGAGPGHDHKIALADGHPPGQGDDRVLPLHFPADQLVGLGHGDGLGHPGHVQKQGGVHRAGDCAGCRWPPAPPRAWAGPQNPGPQSWPPPRRSSPGRRLCP
jgi:hypothetical protein